MRFDGLIGNAELKEQLSSLAVSGRMPHALLIEGPTGSGRRTLAGLLAKAAVCRHSDAAARPCGICPDCIKATAGTHPDITYYGGSDRARSFSIDTVRTLREEGYRLPNEAACRVFVLQNAHALSLEGQNALLRIIEELALRCVAAQLLDGAAQLDKVEIPALFVVGGRNQLRQRALVAQLAQIGSVQGAAIVTAVVCAG